MTGSPVDRDCSAGIGRDGRRLHIPFVGESDRAFLCDRMQAPWTWAVVGQPARGRRRSTHIDQVWQVEVG